MTETMSRRTTLAMLGLALAIAVGAETILIPVVGGGVQTTSDTSRAMMARAFRKMAENIEAGRIDIVGFDVSCSLRPVEHVFSTRFIYKPEA